MNATEQRQRHTAVQTAERRIDDLDLVIQALSMEIVQYRDQFGETLERERQIRRAVIDDERKYRADGDLARQQAHDAFVDMTFWQRFRWLFSGRA